MWPAEYRAVGLTSASYLPAIAVESAVAAAVAADLARRSAVEDVAATMVRSPGMSPAPRPC